MVPSNTVLLSLVFLHLIHLRAEINLKYFTA